MATNDHTLNLDVAFFNELFFRAYPNACETQKHFSMQLVQDGVIQIETLFEQAVAKVGGLTKMAVQGMDFTDGSDAKKTSARTSGYGKNYSANVGQVHTKTGLLRVMCYERKQDQFFYFTFPYESYCHISAKSNIEIPFNLDGTPKRRFSRPVITNWWDYQVGSFEAMATMPCDLIQPEVVPEKNTFFTLFSPIDNPKINAIIT